MATIRENSNNMGDALAGVETEYTMAVGDDFLGTLSDASDNDWVRVELTAGTTYIVKLTGEVVGGVALAADPIVEVRDADGKLIVQNDDISMTNTNSQLEFTPAADGVYYINARSYNLNAAVDNSGGYRLEVDAKPAPGADRTLTGTTGNDKLTGGLGDDTLTGGGGDDTLIGGAGDDELNGGMGDDALTGGAGADMLDGGAGDGDTASYEGSSAGVVVRLHSGVARRGDAEGDELSNIENLVGSAHADRLAGDDRANTVTGGDGDDSLFGLRGNDVLNGGRDNDLLDADEGNDILNGGAGDDDLDAGSGDDMLTGGQGADRLNGGDGDDTASYAGSSGRVVVRLHNGAARFGDAQGDNFAFETVRSGGRDTQVNTIENLIGSDHADILAGDDRANTVNGGMGDDLLFGLDGADTLMGGAGDDTLRGGDGGDTLDGGFGDDIFHGGDGADSFQGGVAGDLNMDGDMMDEGEDGGTDTVSYADSSAAVTVDLSGTGDGGDAEGDTYMRIENIIGSARGDTLTGDEQDNMLWGGAGSDTLNGGNGDDTLDGGAGDESTLNGGADDDMFIARGGDDDIDGGTGSDTVSYVHSNRGVRVDLVDGDGENGYAAGDTYTGVENVIGSNFDDRLIGSDGTDAQGATNTLEGGRGADRLIGGTGSAEDTASYAGSSQGVRVDLSAVNSSGIVTGSGGDAEGDMLSGFENLMGSAHNDRLTGSNVNNDLYGGAGDDVLNGGAGNDKLVGGAGADRLEGGDNIDPNPNDNTEVTDNMGRDFVSYEGSQEDVMVHLVASNNYYAGSGGDAEGDRINVDVEGFIGSGQDGDTLSFAGSEEKITVDLDTYTNGITIGEGANAVQLDASNWENVIGGDGADTLTGDENANRLEGGSGVDTLSGENGNDMLIGGSGADSISGGSGTDTVSYADSNRGVRIQLDAVGTTIGAATEQEGGHAEGDTLASIENVIGSARDDRLIGNDGANVLTGGAGDDILDAASGVDTFVFNAGDGNDEILNFSVTGGGRDTIDLTGFSNVVDMDDLEIEVGDENTVISVGDVQITLVDVTTALTADNFEFMA